MHWLLTTSVDTQQTNSGFFTTAGKKNPVPQCSNEGQRAESGVSGQACLLHCHTSGPAAHHHFPGDAEPSLYPPPEFYDCITYKKASLSLALDPCYKPSTLQKQIPYLPQHFSIKIFLGLQLLFTPITAPRLGITGTKNSSWYFLSTRFIQNQLEKGHFGVVCLLKNTYIKFIHFPWNSQEDFNFHVFSKVKPRSKHGQVLRVAGLETGNIHWVPFSYKCFLYDLHKES